MRWFAASAALGGMTACGRAPNERRYPYNDTPEGLTPGIPQHYATSFVHRGYATGLVVCSREGRPIKIEGNPDHPASLGATGALEQASVLEVYDPRRLQGIVEGDRPRRWEDLHRALQPKGDGARLRFVLEHTGSPLRVALLQEIRRRWPGVKFCFWSPTWPYGKHEAARRIAGRPVQLHHDFGRAARVLSLDADFMDQMPFALRHARAFADHRRVESARGEMNRLYVAECKPSTTGSLADERIACRSAAIGAVAAAVLAEVLGGEAGIELPGLRGIGCADNLRAFATKAAVDLLAHPRESVVVVGERQPWPVHAIAHAINEALGGFGRTAWYTDPVLHDPGEAGIAIEDLVAEMHAGEVDTLVIDEVDPVYALPPALGFAEALPRVGTTLYRGLFANATSQRCRFVVPAAHALESWGDAVAFDGTISFLQPLLQPLGAARTLDELLALFVDRPWASARELMHEYWLARLSGSDPLRELERLLQAGFVPDSGAPRQDTPALAHELFAFAAEALAAQPPAVEDLELSLHESPCVYDGRYAHNAWLQELPEPITKLTWGNAFMLSPDTAERLGVADGDVVSVRVGEQSADGPVVVVPTHAPDAISVHLGYGQRHPDRPHFDPLEDAPPPTIGFDAFVLRERVDQYWRGGASVVATGERVKLARTQDHFDQLDRELAMTASLERLHDQGELAAQHRRPVEHLFMIDREERAPQWGMVIDMTVCTGCSACVVACQAENNIPVVGEVGVAQGREMHWLRIDRYYVDEQRVVHQPMLCQHCEFAPCEYVCPVYATLHSPDGLNEMVYNRCIGTRFCSNNCPYKVRRFIWFDYPQQDRRALQRNPEVTVRERGVMEKCTYCVQRIRKAEIAAHLAHRSLADGDVVTACQQACPTQAIVFGDIADPGSRVSQWRRRPHQYAVLHEQGTVPRTRYLVKLVNRGPEVT
jgi:molybdopterin-containing oxidoreductase family iron-sulfur binding subunit